VRVLMFLAGGFQARYELDAIVVDGANKQAVEEMRRSGGSCPCALRTRQGRATSSRS